MLLPVHKMTVPAMNGFAPISHRQLPKLSAHEDKKKHYQYVKEFLRELARMARYGLSKIKVCGCAESTKPVTDGGQSPNLASFLNLPKCLLVCF